MDNIIGKKVLELVNLTGGQGDVLGTWEVLFSLSLCLFLSLLIATIYRHTHKSSGYSQSFMQTLVITALVTTLIMIVIGSNIARAFSLVGALSIIRFRNAVKETRDVGYIFFVMAIAMACGTRFYGVAFLATLFISSVSVVMQLLDFGTSRKDPERLLRVQMPPGARIEQVLEPVLRELFTEYHLILVETVRQGLYTQAHFSVRPRKDVDINQVLDKIAAVKDNLKIAYHYHAEADDQ